LNIGFVGTSADACKLHVLAYDGVYIDAPRLQRSVLLPSGGKADIAVACTEDGRHALGTLLDGVEQFGGLFSQDTHIMVTLDILSSAKMQSDHSVSLPNANPRRFPVYADLSTRTPTGFRTFLFSDSAGGNNVDGWPYNGSISHSVELGSVQEWTVVGGEGVALNNQHPYHQHVSHFQITSISLPAYDPLVAHVGDYRDTVVVYAALNYTVRFVAPTVGPMMIHCHILKHEDAGMMTIVNITEPEATPRSISLRASWKDERRFIPAVVVVSCLFVLVPSAVLLGIVFRYVRNRECRCQMGYTAFPDSS